MFTSTFPAVVAVTILCFCIFSTSHGTERGLRVKRDDAKERYIYLQAEEDKTTKNYNNVPDICKPVEKNTTTSERKKINILFTFMDLTTTTTTEMPEEAINISILSSNFLNCPGGHVTIEYGCYHKLPNGSVFVPLYSRQFDRSNYILRQGLLFLCPNFFVEFPAEEKFSLDISTVSIVCMCISVVFIIVRIIMFFLMKRFRNLPGYVLISLCIALLSAYVCSFIQFQVSQPTSCMIIGMFMLYFFLASFFWMNTMSYDVWRSIRIATCTLRPKADKSIMVRFARYSLYSWGAPLLIVIVSIIVHHTSSNIKYQLIFDISTCWFKYKQSLITYFAVPLLILLLFNAIFFISSVKMITRTVMSKPNSQNKHDMWLRLFFSLRLGSAMGLMWIFGIIAAFTEQEWLWYLYAVCNALQGVFIFFNFSTSEKIMQVYKRTLQFMKLSTLPTQTSNQQTSTF